MIPEPNFRYCTVSFMGILVISPTFKSEITFLPLYQGPKKIKNQSQICMRRQSNPLPPWLQTYNQIPQPPKHMPLLSYFTQNMILIYFIISNLTKKYLFFLFLLHFLFLCSATLSSVSCEQSRFGRHGCCLRCFCDGKEEYRGHDGLRKKRKNRK